MEGVDGSTLDRLLRSGRTVVVHFAGQWSAPSRMVGLQLEDLASRRSDDALFVTIDVYDWPEVRNEYRIVGVPTVAVFKGGIATSRLVGVRAAADYEAEL